MRQCLILLGILILAAGEMSAQPPPQPAPGEQAEAPAPATEPDTIGVRFDSLKKRDPFRNLLLKTDPTIRQFVGPPPRDLRAPGVSGMLIAEVQLTGIASASNGRLAVMTGLDKRAHFLRVGDRLFDGHVKEINAEDVVFIQELKDTAGQVVQNQVVKKLSREGRM
ncbi:MAG: hypothetical protein HY652_07605 [Acidobacteria bacterium]|nr:hypothetical protein [Acidobacteriota bacterium]